MKNFISRLEDIIFSTESNETGFVNESIGRMNSKEVLDIVLPVAKKAKYISQNKETAFDFKEIGLFKLPETLKLIWIINFEWVETNVEQSNRSFDNNIATIRVDDETGKIISIWQRGMNKEIKYSEFLKILDEKNRQF